MIYHVTCNTDDNYLQHCCAMLCSLFENNMGLNFHVHILTHGLAEESKSFIRSLCDRYNNKVTIYEVDETKLEGVQFRKNRPLTKAAYYRILLPEILDKSIEYILYLDCDMIVVGSVQELYGLEIKNYALAATLDTTPWNSIHRQQLQLEVDDRAFCSGIMMINLEYWRKNNATEKLLEFSKKKRDPVFLHDQDALNYVFKKQWFLISPKWNKANVSYLPGLANLAYFDIYEYVYTPKIIHFSSQAKPWLNISLPYSGLYKEYLYKSNFPNPSFKTISIQDRILFYTWNIKYYTRKYIIPIIPHFLLVLLKDITSLLRICVSVSNRAKRRNIVLKQGIKKI